MEENLFVDRLNISAKIIVIKFKRFVIFVKREKKKNQKRNYKIKNYFLAHFNSVQWKLKSNSERIFLIEKYL